VTAEVGGPIVARSALYVPGDAPEKLDRCFERGADIIIVDLEDAVAPSAKVEARLRVRSWLPAVPPMPVWVRVNNGVELAQDLAVVVGPGLSGICLPKCADVRELHRVDGMLEAAEVATGLRVGSIRVWPLLESPLAILRAHELATAPRVVGLQIGEVDLMAEAGLVASDNEEELRSHRTGVVFASTAAGLGAPLGPVSPQWRDENLFKRSTEALQRMGFGGRVCIHPRQVAICNDVFTPTTERLDWARRVLEDFELALANGSGVMVDSRGQMIDEAVVRIARRICALGNGGRL